MADKLLVGIGKITIDGVETEHPDALQIEIEISEFVRRNSGTPGGGNAAKFSRIDKVGISFNTGNFDATTLARAMKGTAAEEAPAAIDEDTVAVAGGVAVIDKLIDTTQTITVTHAAGTWAATTAYAIGAWLYAGTHLYKATVGGTSAGTEPTWTTDGSTVEDGTVTWLDMGVFAAVEDTDWYARGVGVYCVEGGGIPAGAPINIAATGRGHDRVEIAQTTSSQHVVTFDGVNEESGEPMSGYWPQVVFDPATVQLITAEYGGIDVAGEALKLSNPAAGRSGFGTLRMGDATIL